MPEGIDHSVQRRTLAYRQHGKAAKLRALAAEHDELPEHDGGIELLIRYAQQTRTSTDSDLRLRYWRELTYRSSLLLDGSLEQLRDVLGRLVVEVGQARDAESAERAERRGLL